MAIYAPTVCPHNKSDTRMVCVCGIRSASLLHMVTLHINESQCVIESN